MENRHEVAVTAIIVKEGKFLLTRRSMTKKRFPGKWTVPGGRLEVADYKNSQKDTPDSWHNILERVAVREVKEEVGLTIKNIDYLVSLATIDKEGVPILVISLMAEYEGGEVKLQEEETDKYVWVTLEEAKEYELYGGIYGELEMANSRLKGIRTSWHK